MTSMRLLPLILLLSACVATGTPLRDARLSDQAVLINVPIAMQESEYDCGVAVLSMLLAYYGKPCDEERAAALRRQADSESGLSGAMGVWVAVPCVCGTVALILLVLPLL